MLLVFAAAAYIILEVSRIVRGADETGSILGIDNQALSIVLGIG